MTASDTTLKRAISLAIIGKFTESDWTMLGLQTGTTQIITGHPRLLKSLFFDDPDYPSCVARVLNQLFKDVETTELVGVIEDLIDLPMWLREHYPNLFHDIYGSELDQSLHVLEEIGIAEHVHEIPRHIARIQRSIETDPEQAIGSAKELLESVLRTILDDHNVSYAVKGDIPKLVKLARTQLGLEAGRTGTARDRILNGLTSIATGVNDLRNLHGTGHGRSRASQPDAAYAHLVVNSSATIARFFMEIHQDHRTDVRD